MDRFVSEKFGLFGVSGGTSDMRDLLAREESDVRAEEAVALFVYQIVKAVGAYATVLEGLDTLVFSGGIGERSPRSGVASARASRRGTCASTSRKRRGRRGHLDAARAP